MNREQIAVLLGTLIATAVILTIFHLVFSFFGFERALITVLVVLTIQVSHLKSN